MPTILRSRTSWQIKAMPGTSYKKYNCLFSGKVAFCVRLDHALKNVRIGQIIDFGTVLLNEGSGYNPTTGHFIAPTSGVYQFSYFISHNTNPQSQKWARLRANGRVVNAAVADAFHKHQDVQGGNVGIVRLNAGERAWIESWHVYDAVFNAGFHFSTFSGVLIYK